MSLKKLGTEANFTSLHCRNFVHQKPHTKAFTTSFLRSVLGIQLHRIKQGLFRLKDFCQSLLTCLGELR